MTPLLNLGVVCSVDDAPAVSLVGVSDGDVITDLRVKSLDTGRIYRRAFAVPEIRDDRIYVMIIGFGFGEKVGIGFDVMPFDRVSRWFLDDEEVPFSEWTGDAPASPEPQETPEPEPEPEKQQEPVEHVETIEPLEDAPAEDDAPSEASEDVQEDEGQESGECELDGGVTGCTIADLRTALLGILRSSDQVLTTRAIAERLGENSSASRVRISNTLIDLEEKGLVKRAGSAWNTTGKSATTWVIA